MRHDQTTEQDALALYEAAQAEMMGVDIELDDEDPFSGPGCLQRARARLANQWTASDEKMYEVRYSLNSLKSLSAEIAASMEADFMESDSTILTKAEQYDALEMSDFVDMFPNIKKALAKRAKNNQIFHGGIDKAQFLYYHAGIHLFINGKNTLGNLFTILSSVYPELMPELKKFDGWKPPKIEREYKKKDRTSELPKVKNELIETEASVLWREKRIKEIESDKEFMKLYNEYNFHRSIISNFRKQARRLREKIKRITK